MPRILGFELHDTVCDGQVATYSATRTSDKEHFFVKLATTETSSVRDFAKLRNEYDLTVNLEIYGVLKALDLVSDRSGLLLVQESFSGIPLNQILKEGLMNLESFLNISIPLVKTIVELHANNIVHKEIRPLSILVDQDGSEVRLTNFGIASRHQLESSEIEPNVAGVALSYIAPEQTGRMNCGVDNRTDIYSLGITFYEMLTSLLPFPGDDPLEVVHAHLATKPTPPNTISDTPDALSKIVMKMLAKDANERYQSAHGLLKDLEWIKDKGRNDTVDGHFECGNWDFNDRLQISKKQYGRSVERQALLSAFERAAEKTGGLMLVSGYAGVGKSTLIEEIHIPVVQRRGIFVSGKFDQFKRDLPYHALIEAFKELIRQLLTEPEEQVSIWKNKLLNSLGTSVRVAAQVIPELELIVGEQKKPRQLGPTETQNRFKLVFQTFVGNFARPGRPLVIFLDDLQWADSASLNLIDMLNQPTTNRHLLIIGAYRDREVKEGHSLELAMKKWKKDQMPIEYLALKPLRKGELNELVADSLGMDVTECAELSDLIHEKTLGNPFFSIELLKEFHQQGLLYFEYDYQDRAGWRWDLNQIGHASVTDSVVELMLQKVQKLSAKAQEILSTAACIGNQFDLRTLSIVAELDDREVLETLIEASGLGLLSHTRAYVEDSVGVDFVLAERHVFRFAHDRVQQAAHFLIPEEGLARKHSRIGRLMLENVASEKLENELFEIVNHLNFGASLLDNQQEKLELIRLNHRAARRARAATAYGQAARYLATGESLLQEEDWVKNYELVFALNLDRAECEYLSSDSSVADNIIAELIDRAESTMDQVAAFRVQTSSLSHLQRLDEAIDRGLQCLAVLDIELPKHPTKFELLKSLLRVKLGLRGKSLADLASLPKEMPEQRSAAMSVLWDIWGPAFLVGNENLQGLVVFEMVSLSLRWGNSRQSPIGYTGYGVFLASVMKQVREGYEFSRMSLRLAEEFGDPIWVARPQFIHSAFLSHHGSPLRQSVEDLETAFEKSVESGDFLYAGYCSDVLMFILPYTGASFDAVTEKIIKFSDFARRVENRGSIDTIEILNNWLNRMRGDQHEGNYSTSRPSLTEMEIAWDVYLTTTAAFFERDFQYVIDAAPGLYDTPITDPSAYFSVQLDFMYCLSMAANCHNDEPSVCKKSMREIRARRKRIDKWAENSPENFDFKKRLLDAEMARLTGSIVDAIRGYDDAIELARRKGFQQFEALGNELAGRFHIDAGVERIARTYLTAARYSYWKWGAKAKVSALEEEFGDVLEAHRQTAYDQKLSDNFDRMPLDLATVLKAAQAISSEIVLDQLLERLMVILVENAGAQRGVLLLDQDGALRVEAELDLDEQGGRTVNLLQSRPLDESDNVPASIVNFVVRASESVLINEAKDDQRFAHDPYVMNTQPKSVLCAPLLARGNLTGAIYLENNLSSQAFTEDRLALVNLLFGQVAISIQNAQLFTDQVNLVDSAKRFVPMEFMHLLNKKGLQDIRLGDHVRLDLTFMVTDIRSFTAISERMTPEENFEFINDYFHSVVPQIEKHDGFVGKYTGDGLMAFFPGSADDAVQSAIDVMKQLHMYNAKRGADDHIEIETGIGLHYGSAMLGIVGQKKRMQGDVMSDAANLTSRIEGLCRIYGAPVLISEATFSHLSDRDAYQHRWLGKVLVKGRAEPVQVYEICDGESNELAEKKVESAKKFEEALTLFYERRFAEASVLFERIIRSNESDRAAQLYLKRCAFFMVNQPKPDWAGVEMSDE